jgi:hypothetical protein
MTKYSILFNGGPHHGKMVKDLELDIKPGETFNLHGKLYQLMDGPAAKLSYEDGQTPPRLMCNAKYIDVESN